MIETVQMYRLVCDEPGCGASPQDETEYWAWAQESAAIDTGNDAEWTIRPGLHLCPEHGSRTVCMGSDEECPRRDVTEAEDGWMYCPEHIGEGS